MILTEKETTTIEDLRTQEQSCIAKYNKYKTEAKDPVLRDLFEELEKNEQKHYDALTQILEGNCAKSSSCDLETDYERARDYEPKATYDEMTNSEDKKHDCYLATDCIGTEKLVSGEYNSDVFVFGNGEIRKVLAQIQIEEQNHAQMLWKYKTANGMVA